MPRTPKPKLKPKSGRPIDGDLKARREEEILIAATTLFAEKGYDGADTQALADQLGVGKGTIYRYFPSKKALFLAAVDRIVQQLMKLIGEATLGAKTPFERLRSAVRVYLKFYAANPDYIELAIQSRALFKEKSDAPFFQHHQNFHEEWHASLKASMIEGHLRKMPPAQVADVMRYVLFGAATAMNCVERDLSVEERADEITDIIFYGVKGPKG